MQGNRIEELLCEAHPQDFEVHLPFLKNKIPKSSFDSYRCCHAVTCHPLLCSEDFVSFPVVFQSYFARNCAGPASILFKVTPRTEGMRYAHLQRQRAVASPHAKRFLDMDLRRSKSRPKESKRDTFVCGRVGL